MAHPYSTRHLEENHKLGDAIEATEVYGPDNILLRKCEEAFESARAGFLGLVLMAGDPGDTMEDHIYFDEKFKFMKSGANIVKFPDHIVHCPGLGNLSTKNRVRDRFSGSESRQATGQGLSGPNFRHESKTGF